MCRLNAQLLNCKISGHSFNSIIPENSNGVAELTATSSTNRTSPDLEFYQIITISKSMVPQLFGPLYVKIQISKRHLKNVSGRVLFRSGVAQLSHNSNTWAPTFFDVFGDLILSW